LNFNQLSRGGRRQVSRKVRVRVEGIKVLVRIKENLRELNNIWPTSTVTRPTNTNTQSHKLHNGMMGEGSRTSERPKVPMSAQGRPRSRDQRGQESIPWLDNIRVLTKQETMGLIIKGSQTPTRTPQTPTMGAGQLRMTPTASMDTEMVTAKTKPQKPNKQPMRKGARIERGDLAQSMGTNITEIQPNTRA
jgi:hypothetical protein